MGRHMGADKKWSEDDDSLLRSLYEAGEQWDEIGTDLERTAHSCQIRASRLGLTKREVPS